MNTAAAEAPAAPATTGGSILTQGVPDAPPSKPTGEAPKGPENGIAVVTKAIQRPEWAPEKFWDADKNDVRKEDLGKAYTNLEKLLGGEKVPKPLNDEDSEGWDRWYAASGRPEAADKYDFKRPDKLPDGLGYDEELEKSFRSAAYASGLNKRQATALYDQFVKQQLDRHGAMQVHNQQARAKVEADMRRELGNQYEGALGKARSVMGSYADPEFRQWLDESGLGNDPRMIRVFSRIGQDMAGEQRLIGKPAPSISVQDAQRAIAEHRTKYAEALNDRNHPDHKMRLDERSSLFAIAYPEQGA